MSLSPEAIHALCCDGIVTKLRNFLRAGVVSQRGELALQAGVFTCLYCGEICSKRGFFCGDKLLAVVGPNGKIDSMSECFYEYMKDKNIEILEWITE